METKKKLLHLLLNCNLVQHFCLGVKNFLMICDISISFNAREITLGISKNYIDNQNTVNHILLISKCYIYIGVDVKEETHTYTEVLNTSNIILK